MATSRDRKFISTLLLLLLLLLLHVSVESRTCMLCAMETMNHGHDFYLFEFREFKRFQRSNN